MIIPFSNLYLYRLWNGCKEWEDDQTIWKKEQFMKVDIEMMNAVVERLTKVSFICAKELEGNEVAKNFKSNVDSFKDVVEIITSLREPALIEVHWQTIKDLIHNPDVPNSLWENRGDVALTLRKKLL